MKNATLKFAKSGASGLISANAGSRVGMEKDQERENVLEKSANAQAKESNSKTASADSVQNGRSGKTGAPVLNHVELVQNLVFENA